MAYAHLVSGSNVSTLLVSLTVCGAIGSTLVECDIGWSEIRGCFLQTLGIASVLAIFFLSVLTGKWIEVGRVEELGSAQWSESAEPVPDSSAHVAQREERLMDQAEKREVIATISLWQAVPRATNHKLAHAEPRIRTAPKTQKRLPALRL